MRARERARERESESEREREPDKKNEEREPSEKARELACLISSSNKRCHPSVIVVEARAWADWLNGSVIRSSSPVVVTSPASSALKPMTA